MLLPQSPVAVPGLTKPPNIPLYRRTFPALGKPCDVCAACSNLPVGFARNRPGTSDPEQLWHPRCALCSGSELASLVLQGTAAHAKHPASPLSFCAASPLIAPWPSAQHCHCHPIPSPTAQQCCSCPSTSAQHQLYHRLSFTLRLPPGSPLLVLGDCAGTHIPRAALCPSFSIPLSKISASLFGGS